MCRNVSASSARTARVPFPRRSVAALVAVPVAFAVVAVPHDGAGAVTAGPPTASTQGTPAVKYL